jgi:hypothetical protein
MCGFHGKGNTLFAVDEVGIVDGWILQQMMGLE